MNQERNMILVNKKKNAKTPATLRLQRDLLDFSKDSYLSAVFNIENQKEIIETGTANELILEYENSLVSSVYSKCKIKLKIQIDNMYPISPPILTLLNRVYHPYVYNDKVCLNLLREDWSPVLSLNSILLGFSFLFNIDEFPTYIENPLNTEIGELYNINKKKFMENLLSSISGGTVDSIQYDKISIN